MRIRTNASTNASETPSIRRYLSHQHHWETASGAKSYITEKIAALCPKLHQLTLEVPFDIHGRQYEKLLHPHTFETLQALHSVGEDTTPMTKELVTSTHLQVFIAFSSPLARSGRARHKSLDSPRSSSATEV
ncbi:hypothetical protein FRC02_003352 [Tulasnella sp. 418]|nr:hypothetical protein FRC02_003352 [Tulasnella sp. 418]